MAYVYCVLSILLTVICWGVYGPVLHWGQGAMAGGKLRPLICVGVAYFVIAVVVPVLCISAGIESDAKFKWTFNGVFWSLAAGAAGAFGALGIILALTNKGNPSWVMPLVFGGAPVVNSFLTIAVQRQWGQLNPMFLAGLLLVGVGAVTVLVFKPSPAAGHGPAKSVPAATAAAPKPSTAESSTPAAAPSSSTPSDPAAAATSSDASSGTSGESH